MENAIADPMANAVAVQMEIRHAAVVRSRLGIFQDVPYSANGMNQGPQRCMIHFTAQAVNVNVHNIRRRINSHSPHVVKDHSASHHASRVSAEILEQGELLRSQLQQLIASPSLTPDEVQLQVRRLKACRFSLRCGASQQIS